MNIVQINQTYGFGSTGKIMADLDSVIRENGHNSYMVCGYSYEKKDNLLCTENMPPFFEIRKDLIVSRITGTMGYRYKTRTQKVIEWINQKKPDIIHLHNIHGDWIHLETLFNYISQKNIPVVWTLHDCWAFTGRCSHFELCGCEKWKTQCCKCNNKKIYPVSYFFDKSKSMYADKKKLFTSIPNMTIVTPSKWLAEYVKRSYLNNYRIEVIHNGIDTEIFRPYETLSPYLMKCLGKCIILGVANSWSSRKGFDDFIKLDAMIDHEKYQIVMVGLNKKQLQTLPHSILGIVRTNSQQELAELYSSANVFVNLTYQDNFPTTNLEAQSCGTPCITYNTGGSPESINNSEFIIEQGRVDLVYEIISKIRNLKIKTEDYRRYALMHYKKSVFSLNYIKLYESVSR